MPDRSTKQPPEVDDLLAPPPFGVAETTGNQLLPIATSMENVFDEDGEPEPEPEPEPALVAAPEPEVEPSPSASMSAAAAPVADLDEAPASSSRTMVVAVVVVLLLGAGGFLWMNRGADTKPEQPTNANAGAGAIASADEATPSAAADAAPARGQSAPSAPSGVSLPTELEALRKLPFAERHAGLASASGDVPVELHVGLDLVQAQESDEPCRTFSDALSIVESSEDPTTFKWAVDEASVPTEGDAPSCAGLTERLAAARGPSGGVKNPEPRPRPTSRGNTRSKPRPSRTKPVAEPSVPTGPAEKKPDAAKPRPPPAREARSVSTKLDDDLRGLGE